MRQIPAGDQVALGVIGQPAFAGTQELVYLLVADPVVLAVVEHWQSDVEVVDRVRDPQAARQPHGEVPAVAPLRELLVQRHRAGVDLPAERREEPLDHVGASAARHRRQEHL